MAAIVDASEAEREVEALEARSVAQVGSRDWLRQHVAVQKLNLQAHACVQEHRENYVLEALVTHDKLRVLLHELVVIEAWREKVLARPEVTEHLAERFTIRGYHTAFHEAAICNLLEVVLYHDYAAQACGDVLVELVDYCCRRVRRLAQRTLREEAGNDDEVADKDDKSSVAEFKRQIADIEWRCAVASISVLRFLCEHVKDLPLSVMTRLLDTHDVPCLVIPLIENPPWTRRREDGTWEKLQNHVWVKVPPQDLLLLTPLEAQPWLVLFNLLCEGEVRQRYHFHSFRRDQILRIRKYLNTVLVDQLPVLADLQRALDELVIMDAPPATATSSLVMEQVAEVREALLSGTDWEAEARRAMETHFAGEEARDDPLVGQLAGLYGDDQVEQLLSGNHSSNPAGDAEDPTASNPAAVAEALTAEQQKEEQDAVVFPRSVRLLLQSGLTLDLKPGSAHGTEQTTSKGRFQRFQLVPAQESAGSDEGLGARVPELEGVDTVLKLCVESSAGEKMELFSKPLPCGAARQAEQWVKLGSLKTGALAQVQCCAEPNGRGLRLASAFLSLRQPNRL